MATLSVLFMESATSTTALRIIDAAIRKGHNVNVMAYEGAPADDRVAALLETAKARGVKLDWRRGDDSGSPPADFYKEQVIAADNVLVIPRR